MASRPDAYAEIASRARNIAAMDPNSGIARECKEIADGVAGKLKETALIEFGKAKQTAEQLLASGAIENAAAVWAHFPQEYMIEEIAGNVRTQESGLRLERAAADAWKRYEAVYDNYTRKGLYEEAGAMIAEFEASLDNSDRLTKAEYANTAFKRKMESFRKILDENVKLENEAVAKLPAIKPIEQGESAWRFGGEALWTLAGGVLTGDFTSGEGADSTAVTGSSAWRDALLSFEFRMKSGSLNLGLRGMPSARSSGYNYEILALNGSRFETGRWYKAVVKLKGNYVVAAVEGTLIREEMATARTQGRIAFFLKKGASVELKNISVRVISKGTPLGDDELE
jgi:hypothetical protein